MSTTDAPRYCYRHPDRETGLSCSECGRPICYECMTPAAVGLRCPEHSGKPQGVQRVTQGAQRAVTGAGARRTNVVTMVLIGVNVAVYLAELAIGGGWNGTNNWIFDHGVLAANAQYTQGGQLVGVAHGEWWRLVTSPFLHYGPIHLALNMYSLYYAGSLLEVIIGRWRFLLLYVASGLAGSAGALWLTPNAFTVGASGAIFGVLGALFVLERSRHLATGGQVAMLIVLNLVFSFAFSGTGLAVGSHVTGVTISLGGHLGGLIGGMALMYALLNLRRSTLYSVAAGVAVIAVSVAIGLWRAHVGA